MAELTCVSCFATWSKRIKLISFSLKKKVRKEIEFRTNNSKEMSSARVQTHQGHQGSRQEALPEDIAFIRSVENQLYNQQHFYVRKYNTYQPKFKARRPDYYPVTWSDVLFYIGAVLVNETIYFIFFIGYVCFLIFAMRPAIWTFFGVWIAYVLFMIWAVYRGSKKRMKTEKMLIEEKARQQKAERERHQTLASQ